MASTDFISTYFPAAVDLDPATVADVRVRLETYFKKKWPDIDTRPNSVFGDLVLTPMSDLVAGIEVGLSRFMSDLDLENVSNNIIFNCGFVRKYLQNFAVYERETLQSSGIVRLLFNADQAYVIDRRARYQFGSDTFSLRLPKDGPLQLLRVGSALTGYGNERILRDMGDGTFAVDVDVVGVMATAVAAGATGTTDYPMDNLVSATALIDFDAGLPPTSLPELASKTRSTFYAATLATPGGASKFLMKEFPNLYGVSAVSSGDAEMLRDSVNALGISNGAMDVYARSKGFAFTETINVRLAYNPVSKQYYGRLLLPEIPCTIESVTAAASPSLVLDRTVLSRSLDPAKAPMAIAAYTPLEELWLVVETPTNPTTHEILLLPELDLNTGEQYQVFQVAYQADPLLRPVYDTVTAPGVAPVGVSVLARGPIPIVIARLAIQYYRKRGTTLSLENARAEIATYLDGLLYPSVFSESRIYDAMYYAGASDVAAISCTAHVQWSVASRFLPDGAALPSNDLAAALAASILPAPININSSKGLFPRYVDPNIGTANAVFTAVSPRNAVYLLKPENIVFEEVGLR